MASSDFSEVRGFGTARPDWPAMPDRHNVPEVAAHFLKHRVAAILRDRRITAAQLSRRLGETPSAWRSRLNGNRNLSVDDLVALFMLFPDLSDQVIPRSTDVDDWLPASYTGMASGRVDGTALPAFRVTAEVDWPAVSAAIDEWWSAAVTDGTASWSVDARVLMHEVMSLLDHAGLPRRLAAPAAPNRGPSGEPVPASASGTALIRIDWLLYDASVAAVWLDPFGSPTTDQMRALLATAAEAMWSNRGDAFSANVLAIAAPPQVIATIAQLIGEGADGDRSAIVSLGHARKLGKTDLESCPDLQVTLLGNGVGPLLWLLIKS
jgi:hypothetical protein